MSKPWAVSVSNVQLLPGHRADVRLSKAQICPVRCKVETCISEDVSGVHGHAVTRALDVPALGSISGTRGAGLPTRRNSPDAELSPLPT